MEERGWAYRRRQPERTVPSSLPHSPLPQAVGSPLGASPLPTLEGTYRIKRSIRRLPACPPDEGSPLRPLSSLFSTSSVGRIRRLGASVHRRLQNVLPSPATDSWRQPGLLSRLTVQLHNGLAAPKRRRPQCRHRSISPLRFIPGGSARRSGTSQKDFVMPAVRERPSADKIYPH